MRVGFDIGGTFTDIISFSDDGRIVTDKVLSLHGRIGKDVMACVRALGAKGEAESFVHATTVGSNAVIENQVAKTGFITTKGFRDILDIRNQQRPNIYDPNWERIPPLVARWLRTEVNERVLGDGSIEKPLDLAAARKVVQSLLDQEVKAIAVCLINAYLNAQHEQILGALINEMAPDLVVCLSSDIDPQMKEYERASTTTVNASLIPVIDKYLNELERDISDVCKRLLIMQSNGGLFSSDRARIKPTSMIESGPAAGVLAAARLVREAGFGDVLSIDMGGTTVKGCLIEGGMPLEKPGVEVGGANVSSHALAGGGHAVRVPSLDIVEAGAGGGSIAWIDPGGALRVGPRSAGAEPGPVCYGRGGTNPTVTDANVVLGYINPNAIAGSKLSINRDAAYEAIKTKLADPLGLDVQAVAYGIVQVANSAMTRVLKSVSTERGRDARDCALVAFGGSGPVHAAALAESMGMNTLVVPIYPGLFSALGLLFADYRQDYVATVARRVTEITLSDLVARYDALKETALVEMSADGIAASAVRFDLFVNLKYGYQLEEMTLPFPDPVPAAGQLGDTLATMFHRAHQQAFSYSREDPVELVSVKVRASASAGATKFADLAARIERGKPQSTTREAYFGTAHGAVQAPVRARFDIGEQLTPGPMIIEEPDTTIVVPPDWSVRRDKLANLVLERNMSP